MSLKQVMIEGAQLGAARTARDEIHALVVAKLGDQLPPFFHTEGGKMLLVGLISGAVLEVVPQMMSEEQRKSKATQVAMVASQKLAMDSAAYATQHVLTLLTSEMSNILSILTKAGAVMSSPAVAALSGGNWDLDAILNSETVKEDEKIRVVTNG